MNADLYVKYLQEQHKGAGALARPYPVGSEDFSYWMARAAAFKEALDKYVQVKGARV